MSGSRKVNGVRFTMLMHPDMDQALRDVAQDERCTRSEWVRGVIRDALEEHWDKRGEDWRDVLP